MSLVKYNFDSFFNNDLFSIFPQHSSYLSPLADIIEEEKQFLIEMEVPGIKEEDIEINVENKTLTIIGTKKYEKENSDSKYIRTERCYGSFSRSFTLPKSIDQDNICALFKDGILSVKIPKSKEKLIKKIKINTE